MNKPSSNLQRVTNAFMTVALFVISALATPSASGFKLGPHAQILQLLAVLRTRVKMVFRARHCPAWGSARLVGAASSA